MYVTKLLRIIRLSLLLLYHIVGIAILICLLPFLLRRNHKTTRSKKEHDNKVIVLSSVALSYDGRIQKCLKKLVEINKEVILIKPADAEETNPKFIKNFLKDITTHNIGFAGSFSYYPYVFDTLIFLKLVLTKGNYIYCHDAQTSVMGILAGKIKNSIVITDLHEWISETVSISKDGIVQSLPNDKKVIFSWAEKMVLKHSSYVITVGDLIKEAIQKKYWIKREVYIIKNMSSVGLIASHDAKAKHIRKKQNNFITLIYIGQLHYHRNIENLIIGLSYVDGFKLIIQGTASLQYLAYLKHIAAEHNAINRVQFLPPVSPEKMINAIQEADIGIMACKTFSKNLYYSLPNKVFEYLQAEVPILCQDLPAVRSLFEGEKFIKFFNSNDPISFADILLEVQKEEKYFLNLKRQIRSLKKKVFASDDFDIYKKIF
jgi:glycosyltransferase involved in cell wall biosynthesis